MCRSSRCDRLTAIALTCSETGCTVDDLAALASMTALKKVEIRGPAASAWPILAALDHLPDLRRLRLNGIGDAALGQLPAIGKLESLDLSMSEAGSAEGLRSLPSLPSLCHLGLPPATTTAAGLKVISGCSRLESLVFCPNKLEGFRQMSCLLPRTPAFGAVDLGPVLRHAPLMTLCVSGLGLGDELLRELVVAKKLQTLAIADSPVTDAGFNELRELPDLTTVEISGTQVSQEAAKALYERRGEQCNISDNWCCGCMAFTARR